MVKCTCVISGDNGSAIKGILHLSQTSEEAPTIIKGEIKGLTSSGKNAITVNVFGDLSDGGISCGAIFNPFGKNHGASEDEERMVGDLGNVTVDAEGKCIVQKEDKLLKLIGPHSVIGRSVVFYSGEDDCGRGGHELSLVTGNSGIRIACGVIGIGL